MKYILNFMQAKFNKGQTYLLNCGEDGTLVTLVEPEFEFQLNYCKNFTVK